MKSIPKKYNHSEVEKSLQEKWEKTGIYRWSTDNSRQETFVVDTPPPTVSGSLHVGHVFSYTHTDTLVRYKRMRGFNIMYPMGWDDNGLPTERRVQNKLGIKCSATLEYDPNWVPKNDAKKTEDVSRQNFIEACGKVTQEDEKVFEHLWRQLGLSIDWSQTYATIDEHCRRVSQVSFVDLYKKGLVYNVESPTMWDVDFQTALAQADLEDRLLVGAYHDIEFVTDSGESFIISTTRPELLAACIAVVAHPDDERYKSLFGKKAVTPLFYAEVPILASEHANPEKGSGIMMVCTFGDSADVDWWKKSGLAMKQIVSNDGTLKKIDFTTAPFISKEPEKAKENYSKIESLSTTKARKVIAEILAEQGTSLTGSGAALVSDPKSTEHAVKFYEKGERPIEFVSTRQWFVKILDFKEELLAQGEKINWHPPHMLTRYKHWVEGIAYDWCISRQRFFGVPFPVWYRVDENGIIDYQNPIIADVDIESLPVDPMQEAPKGYQESQRGQPGGFTADPDVMDTWATSSLTPQLISHWGLDKNRHKKLFPMDIRPQSHEIIRTWAFYTIVKAWLHENEIPWKNVIISGWILDPDRKKMSKSKGNVVTPTHLLEQYSSDAVRYWAARARLGVDTAFDENVFKNGTKLATKIFNASKFVISQLSSLNQDQGLNINDFLKSSNIKSGLDLVFVQELRELIQACTKSFENFEYAQSLALTEASFWKFCDSYLELVKSRAYDTEQKEQQLSSLSTLAFALKTYLKLFSPFMPYICDEVWSWCYAVNDLDSIHVESWPNVTEFDQVSSPKFLDSFDLAIEVIGKIRLAKTKEEKTLKWPVEELNITCSSKLKDSLETVIDDVLRAGKVKNLNLKSSGEELVVDVILAEEME